MERRLSAFGCVMRRTTQTTAVIFLLFSCFTQADLACKNCGEICQKFSNLEGMLKTVSPYEEDAECEWIIAPSSEEWSQNIFSINFFFTFFETELDHDFVHVYACKEPSCTTSCTPATGSLSGNHTGMTFTVVARAVLLRLSSDGNKINKRGFFVHWTTSISEFERRRGASPEINGAMTFFDPKDSRASIRTNRRAYVSIFLYILLYMHVALSDYESMSL
jgi:hypothetical protein